MTTKRNRRLLLKTARRIETVPESYVQRDWGRASNRSPCGAVTCLAGEIVICSERSVAKGVQKMFAALTGPEHVSDMAIRLAGLEKEDQYTLFYSVEDWPNGIGEGFENKDQLGQAKAAAELLRYLADGGEV